jgi:hypothetical protein
MGLRPSVATRVKDKHGGDYSEGNFSDIVSPIFQNFQIRKFLNPGTSWTGLAKYLKDRARSKQAF